MQVVGAASRKTSKTKKHAIRATPAAAEMVYVEHEVVTRAAVCSTQEAVSLAKQERALSEGD